MRKEKLDSFTLAEMLTVMVITAIVVGMAYSVLSLVRKQVYTIENNFSRTTELSLLEQRLWQDFNSHNIASYHGETIKLYSGLDTVSYAFKENFVLRNQDTLKVKAGIQKGFYLGDEVKDGPIDALSISATSEIPDYFIFISSTPDATLNMNQDGF